MQVQLSTKEVNQMANRILKGHPEFTKPFVLEMLSHGFGYRNFDTFSGVLKQKTTEISVSNVNLKAPSSQVPFICEKTAVRLYLEMYSVGEYDSSPLWAEVELTTEFINKVIEARALVIEKKLSSVRLCEFPNSYDKNSADVSIRDDAWFLCVSDTKFWFRGMPHHGEDAVETWAANIDDLLQILNTEGESQLKQYKWFGGRLFHDTNSPYCLIRAFLTQMDTTFADVHEYAKELLGIDMASASRDDQAYCLDCFETTQQLDISDVAEWVGLHYKINLQQEPELKVEEWFLRYAESHNLLKLRY